MRIHHSPESYMIIHHTMHLILTIHSRHTNDAPILAYLLSLLASSFQAPLVSSNLSTFPFQFLSHLNRGRASLFEFGAKAQLKSFIVSINVFIEYMYFYPTGSIPQLRRPRHRKSSIFQQRPRNQHEATRFTGNKVY
jgi:hypothetical protein